MAVTIYDVARKAGVGIGTVSRVINNNPHISPHTRERVLNVIKELNYQPHAMARGLARKKTQMIAVILPVFTGYFFIELLQGVQKEITKAQYDMILYSVDNTDKTEMFLRKTLREKRVDGVLLISLQIPNDFVGSFVKTGFPIVLVDSYHPKLDSIMVRNKEGAYKATEHLIKMGHKRVAMIDGQLKSSPARVRLDGYRKALRENHLPFDKNLVVISDFVSGQDGFNREAGYTAMKRLLDLEEARPTAVFVSSDIQAAGAIKAIEERRLRIPQDMALVGFDDVEIAEYLELTTMRQPMREMGRLAVQRLLQKIAGNTDRRFMKRFSTQLIVRRSCGAL
jgi:DNA-binding LacI/PurR family transcriptional regulator